MAGMRQAKNADGGGVGAQRRRLEAEVLMYQSDRKKLLRHKDKIEIEKRSLSREVQEKMRALELKDMEVQKVALEIQNIDNELLRLKRHMNAL